jgi:GPH family glycoside/pentoside/hexuronide:cation symporter
VNRTARTTERLPFFTILAWGAPALGYAFPLFFVQVYFLKFATDVLLLPPALVGLLFGAGRIWDAVTDPVAGYLSDRTRSRLGRRRPWMLLGVPSLIAFFAMLWMPPSHFSGGALLLWTAVALFGFYAAYTAYSIPHASLGAELSRDHHDRSRIFGTRHVAFTLGVISAFGALQYAESAVDERAAVRHVVLVGGTVIAFLLLVAPLATSERREHQGRGGRSPWSSMRDVWRNPHARILFATLFIESLGAGVIGVLAPYVAEYVLVRPDRVFVLPACYVGASVVSVPIWVRLSRRYGKRDVWLVAMVVTALAFGAAIFAAEGDVTYLAVLLIFAGAAAGCGGAVGQSILADVIDWDELQSGERKEGAYSATWGFALKAAIGCMIMLTGLALQVSGFQPNVRQAPAALWTLKVLFAGVPFVGFVAGTLIFRNFSLDEAEHIRVRAALDAVTVSSDPSQQVPGSLH